jgi:hypothetical protein
VKSKCFLLPHPKKKKKYGKLETGNLGLVCEASDAF